MSYIGDSNSYVGDNIKLEIIQYDFEMKINSLT